MAAQYRLEAYVVARVLVRDVNVARGRVDSHVEQHGAYPGGKAGFNRRVGVGVYGKHVAVGQVEGYKRTPVAAVGVEPVARAIKLEDQPGLGLVGR